MGGILDDILIVQDMPKGVMDNDMFQTLLAVWMFHIRQYGCMNISHIKGKTVRCGRLPDKPIMIGTEHKNGKLSAILFPYCTVHNDLGRQAADMGVLQEYARKLIVDSSYKAYPISSSEWPEIEKMIQEAEHDSK